MLSENELLKLIRDMEADNIERTTTTKNTNKFCEAICAFANDFPGHRQPGYLIVGIKDNGELSGLTVDDELLKNLGGIRSDGNIQPLPAMYVNKYGRGVLRAQEALAENGNPPAEFLFQPTYFMATLRRRT